VAAAAAEALAQALRAALGRRTRRAATLAAEEIAALHPDDPAVREAAALLAALDRTRFAGQAAAALPDAARVRSVVARL
jgi:hypothetical protein